VPAAAAAVPGTAEPGAAPVAAPAPAGLRLNRDRGTRFVAGGLVLVGGSPVRVLRLTPAGARQVRGWFSGTPVPASEASRLLARRLLDAGLAHPDFNPQPSSRTVPADSAASDVTPARPAITVVIPVRDRHPELARCLAGLGYAHAADRPPVIVVDDASADPVAIAEIAARYGARVIRRPVNGGPGAARNTGLAAAATELVAFLDSDCVPAPGWLDRLLPHFADPAVGAVAPRIVPHQAGLSWLARYEGASSTLDMGARPSIVRPGARVSYVPGAALVARRSAAGAGFADGMFVGEDVDFIWRLTAAGWRVRYEPSATMGHDHRVTFRAWFSRRADYGTSAAALEQLHPGAVRPLYASWWTVGAWTAALSARPARAGLTAAAALTATATALLARRLSTVTAETWPLPAPVPTPTPTAAPERTPTPTSAPERTPTPTSAPTAAPERTPTQYAQAWRLAARLAGGGTLAAGRPIGSALSRTWWPVAIPAAIAIPRLRRPLAALILVPPLLDWADRRPPLDPARYVAARLLDDAAYSLGVWHGCLSRRTIAPLLPMIGSRRPPTA
jgi:mycofactocin system glycosyltransferase